MKKYLSFISFLTAIILLLSIIPSAFAAGTPTFTVSNAEGSPGDEVKLTVDVSNNPGVICIGLDISYDPAVLELKNATDASFGTLSFGPTTSVPFKLSWDESLKPNNTKNGSLVELTFAIKSNALLGETEVAVSYDPDNVFNSDYDSITFSVKSGKVRIKERVINVTGVTTESSASVQIGAKKTLSYTVQPSNATNKKVSFSSNNPSVAKVDAATGEITGVKRGTATITIKTGDGNYTATCNVTVTCNHSNLKHVSEKASTCTERGWEKYSTCNICGQILDKNGNEISGIPYSDLGHDWGEWVQTKAPTETEPGSETRTCKRDSSHTETRAIPEIGHKHQMILQPAKEPTYTEEGNIAYYVCSSCDKWFLDKEGTQEIIDKDSVIISALTSEKQEYNIGFERGAVWDKSSKEDFVVTADGDALIDHILIDGKKVNTFNYEVDNGPRTVTLKAEYLKTIPTGEHTIKVVTTDGEGTANFTLTEGLLPTEEPTSPEANVTHNPETDVPETPKAPVATEKPASDMPDGGFNWWIVTTFVFVFLFIISLVIIVLLRRKEKKDGK